ncbi:MAG: Lrp/AsnC ligand binding domain-containing protein [Bacteroidia bacterium]|nr:Lrp/AsnC ligand binding domain-containing protein [Bacteroidia bacterium]
MKRRREVMDEMDYRLLTVLAENPTESYSKIKDRLNVSIGTVYLRTQRLREWGVIKGTQLILDPKRLGYSLSILLRLQVVDIPKAVRVLEARPEVSMVYVLTGEMNLMAHVYLRGIAELQAFMQFLVHELKAERIETQVVLDEPVRRGVPIPAVDAPSSGSASGRAKATKGKAPAERPKGGSKK